MTARRRAAAASTVVALAAASGCAPTTYEGAAATVATSPAASAPRDTDTRAGGDVAEVLRALQDEAAGLSNLMIEGGDDEASATRIEELWQSARQQVAATRPELLADFDANVRRCRTAVQFRRAADADKAASNLRALVAAYLG